LLAGPAVGPATVLGIVGGAVGLVWGDAGRAVGMLCGVFARWIIEVGQHGAALPGADIGWGSGVLPVAALAVLCGAVALAGRWVLQKPLLCASLGLATAVLILRPGVPDRLVPGWTSPGWPPENWVMVTCDVGQGDATVLNAGRGTAVVVDA